MVQTGSDLLAPCIVVAGPANSGKTTFLHQIDELLQHHPDRPLVYIVKGSPDATGRYLHHSPELREPLKDRVKGVWNLPATLETIRCWILNARRCLELVLVDFGGRHSPTNAAILACCTHYIVVARTFPNPVQEQEEGMDSWDRSCREQGLLPVAHIRSMWQEGKARLQEGAGGADDPLAAAYRSDSAAPGDWTNQHVVSAVAERLLTLRIRRGAPAYFDLRLDRDWREEDLGDLAGHLAQVRAAVEQDGRIVLGGRAPTWAYLASMHRALDCAPAAIVELFDPKLQGAFIRIPEMLDPRLEAFPPDYLVATWESSTDHAQLDLRVVTPDRMLPEAAALALGAAPLPAEPAPRCAAVVVTGAAPLWIHMTYSRWVRSAGMSPISVWDARSQRAVCVHPAVTAHR